MSIKRKNISKIFFIFFKRKCTELSRRIFQWYLGINYSITCSASTSSTSASLTSKVSAAIANESAVMVSFSSTRATSSCTGSAVFVLLKQLYIPKQSTRLSITNNFFIIFFLFLYSRKYSASTINKISY